MAVPLAVAETVFDSATVDVSIPVAVPFAPVGPAGCVSVLPFPVAASTTVAALTGFPKSSFAVTMIVDDPLPATNEAGDAVTVDTAADTGPAVTVDRDAETGVPVTVTAAVWVIRVPSAVAETVFDSTTDELKLPVATPFPSVGPAGCVSVFPVPVAARTTVAPPIGFPKSSLTVTVMLETLLPTGIEFGEAVTVDVAAEAGPGVTVTTAVCVRSAPLARADTVLVSATVEPSAPVTSPLASVLPSGCVRVFPLP